MNEDERHLLDTWLLERELDRTSSEEGKLHQEWSLEAKRRESARRRELHDLRSELALPSHRRAAYAPQHLASRERFRSEIDQAIDKRFARLTHGEFETIVDAWITATQSDLNLACRWWRAGVSPLNRQITELVNEGLEPENLSTRVQGRTVLQHLAKGAPPKWCVSALHWQRQHGSKGAAG